jgi:thymidylate synthase (FAD)
MVNFINQSVYPVSVTCPTIDVNPEEHIVAIARVSSSRENKTEEPEKLINYLIKNKHWSPFEQVDIAYEIVTTRAIGTQLLRHRSFTFQEFSQRYAQVHEAIMPEIRRQADKNRQSSEEVFDPNLSFIFENNPPYEDKASYFVKKHIENAFTLYNELIGVGVAKECARNVLPMCAATKIYMKGSLRSWIHFLDVRLDAHAQKEIQELAQEIYADLKSVFPHTFSAIYG